MHCASAADVHSVCTLDVKQPPPSSTPLPLPAARRDFLKTDFCCCLRGALIPKINTLHSWTCKQHTTTTTTTAASTDCEVSQTIRSNYYLQPFSNNGGGGVCLGAAGSGFFYFPAFIVNTFAPACPRPSVAHMSAPLTVHTREMWERVGCVGGSVYCAFVLLKRDFFFRHSCLCSNHEATSCSISSGNQTGQ